MKILFFGLGSIGVRHAGILSDYRPRHEIFAYRSDRRSPSNGFGIREVYAWRDVAGLKPDAAFITNPTFMHVRTAIKCAMLGMHLFIEKPISHDLKDIGLLKSLCRKKRLTCYTAYCLRFHPVIKKIKALLRDKRIYHARVTCSSYLPDWRPGQDYRKSYSVISGKGGGVLLELSHEIDYVKYLFGGIKSVDGMSGRRSHITKDAEDYADVLIKMRSGISVNLHLDFFSRIKERTLKVDFKDGYLKADLFAGKIDYLYRGKAGVFKFKNDRNEYLKAQISYFLKNINNPGIMNNIDEATETLRHILEIKNG